ncbi:MAG: prolyl oligopeptidase family serine peptidase [Planctomycetes bacterium]|nr:prolyl oligopeptidase family serine peptidase [Planctomycetota bacterium]
MVRPLVISLLVLLTLLPSADGTFVAQTEPQTPQSIELTDCLVLPRVGVSSRSPVRTDALEALMVAGAFTAPKAGDKLQLADGSKVEWSGAAADEEGWVGGEGGSYVYWRAESPRDCIALLKARGHSLAYVNGEPHYGDPYNYGYVHVPVALKKGANNLLFLLGRGRLKASLEFLPGAEGELRIGTDWTMPDFVIGLQAGGSMLGAVNVINATPNNLDIAPFVTALDPARPNEHYAAQAQRIPAMGIRKLAFNIPVVEQVADKEYRYRLDLISASGTSMPLSNSMAQVEFTVKSVTKAQPRRVTFRSAIDGSVQYYAVRPAVPLPGDTDKPGIVLSLHGASVEAIGQARAYGAKSWSHIVCPTNRRPFGFDWEDWGRMDALEVLAHAQATLANDPTKVWLTGHSMGGHGTWTVGAHFPDKFAAIGPSAGWESFYSYAGGVEVAAADPVGAMLKRTSNANRTLLHKYNYKQLAVYVLHGDADDNVPVSEARAMRDALKEFHTDLQYHEEPGVGHWWDREHDDGADCLDWQPMFDTFARRRLPRANEVQAIDFTTVCPEHSSDDHWLRIEMQQSQLAPSRAQIVMLPNKGEFEGTTENIARMSLDVAAAMSPKAGITLRLDGSELKDVAWPANGRLTLRRADVGWQVENPAPPDWKGPQRSGWLKNAFNHQFVMVYGTRGSAAENEWALAKARYDAEQWWYRGNGACDIIPDSEFSAAKYPDRGVILYGNADTNSGFGVLLKTAPVQLRSGAIAVGERTLTGDDLSIVFTFPRADSKTASVVVVGGTGIKGMQVTNRIGYFISGASFPDLLVYRSDTLETGIGGVLGGGYFAEDWGAADADFVWRETK